MKEAAVCDLYWLRMLITLRTRALGLEFPKTNRESTIAALLGYSGLLIYVEINMSRFCNSGVDPCLEK
jgi:hypothetical protein